MKDKKTEIINLAEAVDKLVRNKKAEIDGRKITKKDVRLLRLFLGK